MHVFIAIGRIDYEGDKKLGLMSTLVAAQRICEENPTDGNDWTFDRHYIEEWAVDDGREYVHEWVREPGGTWEPMPELSNLTEGSELSE